MRIIPILFLTFMCLGATVHAQLPDRLSTYFSFDNCDGFDESGNGSAGALVGIPECVCGVQDSAIRFDGVDDAIFMVGPVADVFTTSDFSVSFYMKPLPTSNGGSQVILSKQSGCNLDAALWVRYSFNSETITSAISENDTLLVTVSAKLDPDPCWQHIVLVRSNTTYSLYVNGVLKDSNDAPKRLDLSANSNVKVAEPICPTDRPFYGDIDELQFYNKALTQEEVLQVDLRPDQIINSDTLIYLGNSFDVGITQTCAEQFMWSPSTGVSDDTDPNATFSPTETTEYSLNFEHPNGECIAVDKILITVIDPDTLDCTNIFIPNAFTPGASFGRNDQYGISNPFAVSNFVSFEIFDRWGGRMFNATSPFDTWDGMHQGKPANPGVYLYRLQYVCQGEDITRSGSLTLLR